MLYYCFACFFLGLSPLYCDGATAIIALAFALASGVLLVILSCALYQNWWPLFVVATYILAPIPNLVVRRYTADDYGSSGNGLVEAGYFITAFFITTGFGLPLVLLHAAVIQVEAMILSVFGGLLVYGALLAYIHFFSQDSDGF